MVSTKPSSNTNPFLASVVWNVLNSLWSHNAVLHNHWLNVWCWSFWGFVTSILQVCKNLMNVPPRSSYSLVSLQISSSSPVCCVSRNAESQLLFADNKNELNRLIFCMWTHIYSDFLAAQLRESCFACIWCLGSVIRTVHWASVVLKVSSRHPGSCSGKVLLRSTAVLGQQSSQIRGCGRWSWAVVHRPGSKHGCHADKGAERGDRIKGCACYSIRGNGLIAETANADKKMSGWGSHHLHVSTRFVKAPLYGPVSEWWGHADFN